MITRSELAIEKYTVVGSRAGYRITVGDVLVHNHATVEAEGRLKGTGYVDAYTNAQRGVMWLRGQQMVQEMSKAQKVSEA